MLPRFFQTWMYAHSLRYLPGTSSPWLLMVACLTMMLVGADRIDVQTAIANVNRISKDACTPGPFNTLNMTFDYGQWNRYATIATRTANLLTKLFVQGKGKLSSVDEYFLFSLARNNIRGDELVYGSAISFEPDVFANYSLFSPYAHMAGNTTRAIDLSRSYNYLHPSVEFYATLHDRDWVNQTVTEDNVTYSNGETIVHSQPQASLEDGHWTYPYFDCGAGDIWMVTYSSPIFAFSSSDNKPIFRGVATIDIDLTHIDINQCDTPVSEQGASRVDIFRGTHMCQETTKCRPIKGLGFRSGAYNCECEDGFYFPNPPAKAFNGSDIERALNASGDGAANAYSCLPCPAGCDTCEDDTTCYRQFLSSASSLSPSASLSSAIIVVCLCFFLVIRVHREDTIINNKKMFSING